MTRAFVTLLVGGLLGCAPRPRPPAPPPRISDSVPEKAAAQRAAAPQDWELEGNEERWGIAADQERKKQAREAQEAKQQKAAEGALIPMPRVSADGGTRSEMPPKAK
jgi:hypothetical protein